MHKYLVIVESPAKVKTISKFLGANYKVMASQGHVRDLPKSQMGVDIEHDYEPKYITIRCGGSSYPEFRIATLTLSLASFTSLLKNPLISKPGRPLPTSTSTCTISAFNPYKTPLNTLLYNKHHLLSLFDIYSFNIKYKYIYYSLLVYVRHVKIPTRLMLHLINPVGSYLLRSHLRKCFVVIFF
jgi:hypothetical protein